MPPQLVLLLPHLQPPLLPLRKPQKKRKKLSIWVDSSVVTTMSIERQFL
jgi:hypothetical protein